jgi:hypothetical protein
MRVRLAIASVLVLATSAAARADDLSLGYEVAHTDGRDVLVGFVASPTPAPLGRVGGEAQIGMIGPIALSVGAGYGSGSWSIAAQPRLYLNRVHTGLYFGLGGAVTFERPCDPEGGAFGGLPDLGFCGKQEDGTAVSWDAEVGWEWESDREYFRIFMGGELMLNPGGVCTGAADNCLSAIPTFGVALGERVHGRVIEPAD